MHTGGDTFYNCDEYDGEGEFGDNLVTRAKRNRPEFIKYAKTAKRIDIEKLKENIWKSLIGNVSRFFKLTIV
jgi:condensin complex subunit 2